jgi:hypothetical protein
MTDGGRMTANTSAALTTGRHITEIHACCNLLRISILVIKMALHAQSIFLTTMSTLCRKAWLDMSQKCDVPAGLALGTALTIELQEKGLSKFSD